MQNPVTKEHLDKSIEKLALMIKKGFDGVDRQFEQNKKEHRQIFDRLGGIVYRHELKN